MVLCACAVPTLAWAGNPGSPRSTPYAAGTTPFSLVTAIPLSSAPLRYAEDDRLSPKGTSKATAAVRSATPSSVAPSKPGSTSVDTHLPQHAAYVIVQPGDTLWDLAARYRVSVNQLEQWNGVTDTSRLQIGETLLMPAAAVHVAHARNAAVHTRGHVASRSGEGSWVSTPVSDSFGERVAACAMRYIGVPYVMGGASPSGFDCSGLVKYVYAMCGVALPHYSGSQYAMGQAVAKRALAPGDLVFFDTSGPGPTHVGIYIGGGRFVSAAGSAVRVDSLNNPYWAAHYIGARRIHG
jgi:peptidoglycan endopeptidase LytE